MLCQEMPCAVPVLSGATISGSSAEACLPNRSRQSGGMSFKPETHVQTTTDSLRLSMVPVANPVSPRGRMYQDAISSIVACGASHRHDQKQAPSGATLMILYLWSKHGGRAASSNSSIEASVASITIASQNRIELEKLWLT